jgi:hypothetical protein
MKSKKEDKGKGGQMIKKKKKLGDCNNLKNY